MKNVSKLFGIIVLAVIIGFALTACTEGGNNGNKGGDNWSKLVGNWIWEEGSSNIKLGFNAEKIGSLGYSFFSEIYLPSTFEGGGSQFFCSYIGTTLRVFTHDNITEYTYTVTISSDNQTITFSNYKEYVSKGIPTHLLNGKTFTKVE